MELLLHAVSNLAEGVEDDSDKDDSYLGSVAT